MEVLDSCVRSRGDLAGVFEHDGETGYFYLYAPARDDGQGIREALQVVIGPPDFGQADVEVRWDVAEEKVGLFIRGVLWAVFAPARDQRFAAVYVPDGAPLVPGVLRDGFDT